MPSAISTSSSCGRCSKWSPWRRPSAATKARRTTTCSPPKGSSTTLSTAATGGSARRCVRCSSTTCASTPTPSRRTGALEPADMTRQPNVTGEPARWTEAQAESKLRSLELFGMRFGLDRMRRMMTVLGSPERRFDAIHVLGTNGKSSTTRMIAAILERHGLRVAAYTSPHLVSYRERVQVDGRELSAEEFAAAIGRAAWAAERVNRTLAEDDHVTQFELLTAAALWQIAQRGVQVAVVKAGLGGRYDATSVIDADI